MPSNEVSEADRDISETLKEDLAAVLECAPGEVDLSERLTDLPGIDSMKLVQVVVACEQHWGIAFDEEELFDVRTGADLLDLINAALDPAVTQP